MADGPAHCVEKVGDTQYLEISFWLDYICNLIGIVISQEDEWGVLKKDSNWYFIY